MCDKIKQNNITKNNIRQNFEIVVSIVKNK